jgi:hypothetical protein
MKAKSKEPVFQYKNGRRSAVLLDIQVYRDLLAALEDAHDAKEVSKRRKRPGQYRPLDELLAEYGMK